MKDFMHCFRYPFFHLSARSKDKELLYCYQNILAICQRKG